MNTHLYPRAPRPLIVAVATFATMVLISSCGSDNDDAKPPADATAPAATSETVSAATTTAATTTATIPPTTAAAPAPTAVPATSAAPTTTAAPPTTVFVTPLSDAEIATRILLDPSEYAPTWTQHPEEYSKTLKLDRTLAADIRGCTNFLDTVFESETRPATTATRTFSSPPGPPATPTQYVVVFPTEDDATAMFEAMLDPLFTGDCLQPYALGTDFNGDKWCCDPQEPGTPALFGTQISSTTNLGSDDIAFRSDNQYWTDATGAIHGPEKVASATVRVGRTINIIEAITTDESGATFTSEEQFHNALTTAVERARAALDGDDY